MLCYSGRKALWKVEGKFVVRAVRGEEGSISQAAGGPARKGGGCEQSDTHPLSLSLYPFGSLFTDPRTLLT